ncbi:Zinc finger, BED-type [Sesbania bispinosa]|nr:Zinc finger, BED-type [Sesbania bispinosa]
MSSLGDPMDSPLRENAGPSISTTPVASGTAAPLPPRNNRSTALDHFYAETGEEKKTRCNYCATLIKYRDGTSGIQIHLKRCKKNPYTVANKRPRTDGASSHTLEGQMGGGVGSSPTYFKFDQEEVFAIGRKIRQCQEHSDDRISLMATRMRSKYDKYWGTPSSINILLLIAVVLDPRCKLDYVHTFLGYLFNIDQEDELKLKFSFGLRSLYEQYQGIEESSQINQEVMLDEDDDDIHEMTSPHEGTSSVAIDLDD